MIVAGTPGRIILVPVGQGDYRIDIDPAFAASGGTPGPPGPQGPQGPAGPSGTSSIQLVIYTVDPPNNPTDTNAPALAYDPTGVLPTKGWNLATKAWT